MPGNWSPLELSGSCGYIKNIEIFLPKKEKELYYGKKEKGNKKKREICRI
jgi:hypothetical protein